MAWWQISVPPRLSLRSTFKLVCASICCASSSARMICSVKFFEPTTAVFWRERWQPASVTKAPPSNVRASRLVRRAAIVWMTDGSRCRREFFLDQTKNQIHANRQQRRRDCPRQNHGIADHGHSTKNKDAQSARADGGRNRGNAYADDHGDSHAGENHGNGEGELHIPKNLCLCHAHAARGLENGRIDTRDSGVGVAQDRE